MKKIGLFFLLSLPLVALGLLWNKLPDTIIIHTASTDQIMSRDDFGGLIVGVTFGIALFSYGLLQLQTVIQPMTPRQMDRAYLISCGGAAFIGLAFLVLGLAKH